MEDEVVWMDAEAAIKTARSRDVRMSPVSRHYALRYHRVRDSADKLFFCPGFMMKADGLTKSNAASAQRRLTLYNYVPTGEDSAQVPVLPKINARWVRVYSGEELSYVLI